MDVMPMLFKLTSPLALVHSPVRVSAPALFADKMQQSGPEAAPSQQGEMPNQYCHWAVVAGTVLSKHTATQAFLRFFDHEFPMTRRSEQMRGNLMKMRVRDWKDDESAKVWFR